MGVRLDLHSSDYEEHYLRGLPGTGDYCLKQIPNSLIVKENIIPGSDQYKHSCGEYAMILSMLGFTSSPSSKGGRIPFDPRINEKTPSQYKQIYLDKKQEYNRHASRHVGGDLAIRDNRSIQINDCSYNPTAKPASLQSRIKSSLNDYSIIFSQLTLGMKYETIANIFGSPGKLIHRNCFNETDRLSESYSWGTPLASITLYFDNGELQSKSKYNIDDVLPSKEKVLISPDSFRKIRACMPYDKVVEILGTRGSVLFANAHSETEKFSDMPRIEQWHGIDGKTLEIQFAKDRVYMKFRVSKWGIEDEMCHNIYEFLD